jgi:hypothetical protein
VFDNQQAVCAAKEMQPLRELTSSSRLPKGAVDRLDGSKGSAPKPAGIARRRNQFRRPKLDQRFLAAPLSWRPEF